MKHAVESRLARDCVCDVLVIGSGAGGLSTAVTARLAGLDVVVVEKAAVFGGTTAFSGGVLWIPGNNMGARDSRESRERMVEYLQSETGGFYDDAAIAAFLDKGPEMVSFFEQRTAVKFLPTLYPDYHPDAPGGADVGRSILAAPFDAAELGEELSRLRPPLKTITFMGMMFNSSNTELKHFFNATRSLRSLFYVARRLGAHFVDVVRHGRGVHVTSGNALVARLAKSAFDLGIAVHTNTAARELLWDGAGVSGAVVAGANGRVRIVARRGVVLACGGFPHDKQRIGAAYPHLRAGGEHLSPVPADNTGDGIRLAESVGARLEMRFPAAAAWIPVSAAPMSNGEVLAFPHLLDRYKPGFILVDSRGRRFTNESNSYHDVGAAMIAHCAGGPQTSAWLLCDQTAINKYGLGYVKPAPLPKGRFLRNGYLKKGNSIRELASVIGVGGVTLERTIRDYNLGAVKGRDAAFGRGSTSFNRYLGDADHKPNPNIAPLQDAPFYAVRTVMGELGTFDGLQTTVAGQVLNAEGLPVKGLFAVGNDRASIMGGNYPAAGITLGPIMTFGYITGNYLAAGEQAPAS